MRPFLAALPLLLLPALGSAQTLTLTVNGASKPNIGTGSGTTTVSTLARNASGCTTSVAGGWVGTSLTTACTTLQLWLTTTTCGTTPSTTNSPPDVVVYTAQAGVLAAGLNSDTFSFAFNILPSFNVTDSDGGALTQPCGSATDFTDLLCAAVTLKDATGACTSTSVQASPINIRYLNIPPNPPVVSVTPLDSKLSVRLTASGTGTSVTDVQSFILEYAVEPLDGGTPNYTNVGGTISTNNPNVTISNLLNGVSYLVQGYSVDVATNQSAPSVPVAGEPVASTGFYGNFIDDGGKNGCGSTTGGAPSALAVLTVLLLGVARRRG